MLWTRPYTVYITVVVEDRLLKLAKSQHTEVSAGDPGRWSMIDKTVHIHTQEELGCLHAWMTSFARSSVMTEQSILSLLAQIRRGNDYNVQ